MGCRNGSGSGHWAAPLYLERGVVQDRVAVLNAEKTKNIGKGLVEVTYDYGKWVRWAKKRLYYAGLRKEPF